VETLGRQSTKSWSNVVVEMSDRLFVGSKPSWRKRPRLWRVSLVSFSWALVLFVAFIVGSQNYADGSQNAGSSLRKGYGHLF